MVQRRLGLLEVPVRAALTALKSMMLSWVKNWRPLSTLIELTLMMASPEEKPAAAPYPPFILGFTSFCSVRLSFGSA